MIEHKERPSWDQYFLNLAKEASTRCTCPRRSCGCVIVDSRKRVVSTGYNAVPRYFPHCLDRPCGGQDFKSGEGLDVCLAIHAEQNAFLQLTSDQDNLTMYLWDCTPCFTCAKMICNSSVTRIVAPSWYEAHKTLTEPMFVRAMIQVDIMQ